MDDELLSGPVPPRATRAEPAELSDRVAMGRALWRELVIGFAAQLGELRLGFTQLAALYALVDTGPRRSRTSPTRSADRSPRPAASWTAW